jgi:hypothetical protein
LSDPWKENKYPPQHQLMLHATSTAVGSKKRKIPTAHQVDKKQYQNSVFTTLNINVCKHQNMFKNLLIIIRQKMRKKPTATSVPC